MRERAASVGGGVMAGRRADGGFLVEAELPLVER
jgi:signal transduction histidine kinase